VGFLANTNFISDKAFKALNVSRDFDQTKALDKVNFEANWGMTIGLFGHNGAGKSTLLKVFAGISAPSSGSVEIAGIDLRKSRSRSNKIIGYVGHQSMLFQNLTILENGKQLDAEFINLGDDEPSIDSWFFCTGLTSNNILIK